MYRECVVTVQNGSFRICETRPGQNRSGLSLIYTLWKLMMNTYLHWQKNHYHSPLIFEGLIKTLYVIRALVCEKHDTLNLRTTHNSCSPSLHVVSATIETCFGTRFGKTKYIQFKARHTMNVSTVTVVIQTPFNTNVEVIETSNISIDTTSAFIPKIIWMN